MYIVRTKAIIIIKHCPGRAHTIAKCCYLPSVRQRQSPVPNARILALELAEMVKAKPQGLLAEHSMLLLRNSCSLRMKGILLEQRTATLSLQQGQDVGREMLLSQVLLVPGLLSSRQRANRCAEQSQRRVRNAAVHTRNVSYRTTYCTQ